MPLRLTKTWTPLADAKLLGHMGVFELSDANHQVCYIGYAGGASPQGLRGAVAQAASAVPAACYVRWEVTTSYHTRYRELLMCYQADHGELPPANPPIKLGRLSPA